MPWCSNDSMLVQGISRPAVNMTTRSSTTKNILTKNGNWRESGTNSMPELDLHTPLRFQPSFAPVGQSNKNATMILELFSTHSIQSLFLSDFKQINREPKQWIQQTSCFLDIFLSLSVCSVGRRGWGQRGDCWNNEKDQQPMLSDTCFDNGWEGTLPRMLMRGKSSAHRSMSSCKCPLESTHPMKPIEIRYHLAWEAKYSITVVLFNAYSEFSQFYLYHNIVSELTCKTWGKSMRVASLSAKDE